MKTLKSKLKNSIATKTLVALLAFLPLSSKEQELKEPNLRIALSGVELYNEQNKEKFDYLFGTGLGYTKKILKRTHANLDFMAYISKQTGDPLFLEIKPNVNWYVYFNRKKLYNGGISSLEEKELISLDEQELIYVGGGIKYRNLIKNKEKEQIKKINFFFKIGASTKLNKKNLIYFETEFNPFENNNSFRLSPISFNLGLKL